MVATVTGVFVLTDTIGTFFVAAVGGIALGWVIGRVMAEVVRWLDDPPVEVVVSLLVPWATYLLAVQFELSGVLAVVTVGLVIGRRLGTILSPNSRLLWLTTWKMVAFVLNGLIFVLIGLALPEILQGLGDMAPERVLTLALLVSAAVIGTRFVYVFLASLLPEHAATGVGRARPGDGLAADVPRCLGRSARRRLTGRSARPARRLSRAQPDPAGDVRGDPRDARRPGPDAPIGGALGALGRGRSGRRRGHVRPSDDVPPRAGRGRHARDRWPDHLPLHDRLESGLGDRMQHLATGDPEETEERRQEHLEHQEIQLYVINAQRAAAIALRDGGEINDETLRELERELDLEELRMEA